MSQSRFNDDAVAKAYQELLLPLIFEPWGQLLIVKAGLRAADRVLDVATGPGTLARQAAKVVGPAGRVTGLDMSPQMLAQANAKQPLDGSAPLDYVEGSAEALPFEDATFDVVLCQQGLQFFSDQLASLKEVKRVLKPDGHLALAMWSDIRGMTLFVAFHDALDATLASPPQRSALGWLTQPVLNGLLTQAGFVAPSVNEETLTVVLEKGLPQALECATGTTAAAALRTMDDDERQRWEAQVSKNLAPYMRGEAIYAPVRALVAVARG